MEDTALPSDVPPRVRARVMEVLREKFAQLVGSSPEAVLAEHLVSGYLSDDPLLRHRFMVQLERAFGVPIDGARFDTARTVGELADLLALKLHARKAGGTGRLYHVCYRDAAGRLVETRVRAKNHNLAVEALRAEGLSEVVTVERDEDDEDAEPRAGRVHNVWTGCVLPLLAAFVVAGGAVAYFWWRRG